MESSLTTFIVQQRPGFLFLVKYTKNAPDLILRGDTYFGEETIQLKYNL